MPKPAVTASVTRQEICQLRSESAAEAYRTLRTRVLEFVQGFHQGGTERQAVQLARLLHESRRYEVHVGCLNGSGILRSELDPLHLPAIPEYPLTSFYDRNTVRQLRRFVRLLRARDIHVVHAHDFYTNIFGMVGAALARVPVRVASRRESGFRPSVHRRIERMAYRFAHVVVANCEEVRRQLLSEGVPAAKVVTIHNGLDMHRVRVDPTMLRKEALTELGLSVEEDRRFVTILANLSPVKDHCMFLRAAKRVHAVLPRTGFLIAGEGEMEGRLRGAADELGLREHAYFLGRCQKVAALLAASDVCVLTSQFEGFPNVILEYMAAARPVVSTDVGGAGEAIAHGETGYLVPVGDDERMALHILSLLQDAEKARRFGAKARSLVQQRFSCAAQLENTERLYERFL